MLSLVTDYYALCLSCVKTRAINCIDPINVKYLQSKYSINTCYYHLAKMILCVCMCALGRRSRYVIYHFGEQLERRPDPCSAFLLPWRTIYRELPQTLQ